MKKNRIMRIASAIMVLAVLTTCIFSGTLAKYIMSDYTTDTARVAKFGVVVTAAGDLFGSSYKKGDTVIQARDGSADRESVTAVDADTTMIVAPGTANAKGMTFSVKGTPEVSTKLTIDAPEGETTTGTGANNDKKFANTDIVLKTGDYSIMVKAVTANTTITKDNMTDYYKLDNQSFVQLAAGDLANLPETVFKKVAPVSVAAAGYYPIEWTVGGTALTGTNNNVAGVLTALNTALLGATPDNDRTPNEAWNVSTTVTWAWDFSDVDGDIWADVASDAVLPNWENTSLKDLEDTILGMMISRALSGSNAATDDYLVAESDTLVNYFQIDAAANSANKVWVAATGTSTPTSWDAATNAACLTATFGARLTVEQVN